jgi:hypothetical protein
VLTEPRIVVSDIHIVVQIALLPSRPFALDLPDTNEAPMTVTDISPVTIPFVRMLALITGPRNVCTVVNDPHCNQTVLAIDRDSEENAAVLENIVESETHLTALLPELPSRCFDVVSDIPNNRPITVTLVLAVEARFVAPVEEHSGPAIVIVAVRVHAR